MALRRVGQLQSFENNNLRIVEFLSERSPHLIDKVRACLDFKESPLLYHDGLETVTLFAIFSLVKLKIQELTSKYNLGSIECEDELFFEIVYGDDELNDEKLQKYVDENNHIDNKESLEKEINRYRYLFKHNPYFHVIFNSKDEIGISIIKSEFNLMIEKFLSQFQRKIKCKIVDEYDCSFRIDIVENRKMKN